MNYDEDGNEIGNDLGSAIGAGVEIAEAASKVTEVHGVPVIITPSGHSALVMNNLLEIEDARAVAPRRRKGTSTHQELESFIAHVNRFKDTHSVVFADAEKVMLTAVLDYHELGAAGAPRWGQHRATYACPLSTQWKLWTGAHEKPMHQDAFGQFIEDNMSDLAAPREGEDFPQPAEVLEMARKLVVRTKGEFQRTVNVTTGEATLVNKLENDVNSTKIPRAFKIGIPVFEAGESYAVEARLRFTLAGGSPSFTYSLYQTITVKRDAFSAVRKEVAEKTGLPVYVGSPEQ
jgi:uncharacterized protein YfdQ (DUF2303 family)